MTDEKRILELVADAAEKAWRYSKAVGQQHTGMQHFSDLTREAARSARGGAVPEREAAWLVERKVSPPQYITENSPYPDLSSDPWRAARFKTEREAFDFRLRLASTSLRDECQVVEHVFINKPSAAPAAAETTAHDEGRANLTLQVVKGDTGLWFVTSPNPRGLLVAGKTMAEAIAGVPNALTELVIAQQALISAEEGLALSAEEWKERIETAKTDGTLDQYFAETPGPRPVTTSETAAERGPIDDGAEFPQQAIRVAPDKRSSGESPSDGPSPVPTPPDAAPPIPLPLCGWRETAKRCLYTECANPAGGPCAGVTLRPTPFDKPATTGESGLRECPWCATNEFLRVRVENIDGWVGHVECQKHECDDMRGPMSAFKHGKKEDAELDAIKVWNTRPSRGEAVPDDVRRLVIAARKVAFEDTDKEHLRELDLASEAFADRIPWENEDE